MNPIQEAANIIVEAEERLKGILGETTKCGEYGLVVQLAGWARALSALNAEIAKAVPSAETEEKQVSSLATAKRITPLISSRKPIRGSYPKFMRNGETIVKIGWSKGNKQEYEHKSPASVLADLITAIVSVSARKHRFVMESILPLRSSRDGAEVPGYQVYLCLAWLRKEGLVIQHGRQGYSVKAKVDLVATAHELLLQLPDQQADN